MSNEPKMRKLRAEIERSLDTASRADLIASIRELLDLVDSIRVDFWRGRSALEAVAKGLDLAAVLKSRGQAEGANETLKATREGLAEMLEKPVPIEWTPEGRN